MCDCKQKEAKHKKDKKGDEDEDEDEDEEEDEDKDNDKKEDDPDLAIIAAQLIQNHLLESSDKSITILVGCCLYDIFRIYAPDAPYEADQLEVFINEELKNISRK